MGIIIIPGMLLAFAINLLMAMRINSLRENDKIEKFSIAMGFFLFVIEILAIFLKEVDGGKVSAFAFTLNFLMMSLLQSCLGIGLSFIRTNWAKKGTYILALPGVLLFVFSIFDFLFSFSKFFGLKNSY